MNVTYIEYKGMCALLLSDLDKYIQLNKDHLFNTFKVEF